MLPMWKYLDEAVALILVIGCFYLLATGIDGEVKSILTMAAGWCFAKGYTRVKKKK